MSEHLSKLNAWAKTSRFHSVGVVLDLEDPDAPGLLRTIQSADALEAVRLARQVRHRFIVLAGQLMRKKAGCFVAATPHAEMLPLAALAAAERLTEAGESWSAWFLLVDDGPRESVLAVLAALMPAEGNA